MDLRKSISILELNNYSARIDKDLVRQAYKRLSWLYHPDSKLCRFTDKREATRKFVELGQAYECLLRLLTDNQLAVFCKEPPSPPPKPQPPSQPPPIIIEVFVSLSRILRGCVLEKKIPITIIRGGRKVKKDTTIHVPIPAGALPGTRVELLGAGHQLDPFGPPGDVICIIRDKPNSLFTRINPMDIEYVVSISQRKWRKGGVVHIPTIDNYLRPPWRDFSAEEFQKGYFRVPGEGLPDVHEPEARGDLIVRFKREYNCLTKLHLFFNK